jgi:acylphosphatase
MSEHVKHVVIRGNVQGVGYRAWTEREARRHGLVGWVRNRRDGSVEAMFAGAPRNVAAMIEACWRGPPAARVQSVETFDGSPEQLALFDLHEFTSLPTM